MPNQKTALQKNKTRTLYVHKINQVQEFNMFVSVRDLVSLATVSLLLASMFVWVEILSVIA